MDSFYLTLPSNSSKNIFPDNKLHSFRIKLQKSLPISQGKWVVGLSEIQFPQSWYNITNAWIRIRVAQNSDPFECMLKDGYYQDIEELLSYIHGILRAAKLEDKIMLNFDKIQNRVIMQVFENSDKSTIGVTFSQNLLNILGFSKKEGDYYSTGMVLEKPTDINEGFSALYIYTDIVQDQIVGDVMVPLIRVVPFKNNSKRNHTWVNFNRVQYLSVLDRQTDSIEINIRRDNGEVIPFQHGKVVVTLHFQRIA